MGTIDDRQLDDVSGRLVAASSHHYQAARRYRGARVGIGIALAALGPLLALWSTDASAAVGIVASAWLLIGRLVLLPAERERTRHAVVIQEVFDTRLFDLPWPASLAGPRPSEEDIADADRAVAADHAVRARHADGWYPSTAAIPAPLDTLLCQWSSMAYARAQHRGYARLILVVTIVLGGAALVVGLIGGMTLADWLVTFAMPALPALLDTAEISATHRSIATRRKTIEDQLDDLWQRELAAAGAIDITACRGIQDESFRIRLDGLRVPEWYYGIGRERYEGNMRAAAVARIQQLVDARSTP